MSHITVWAQDFSRSERFSLEEAQILHEQGFIKSSLKPNRSGKKLKRVWVSVPKLEKHRDQSCQMGPRVIEANTDGRVWAMSIVREWGRTRLRFV